MTAGSCLQLMRVHLGLSWAGAVLPPQLQLLQLRRQQAAGLMHPLVSQVVLCSWTGRRRREGRQQQVSQDCNQPVLQRIQAHTKCLETCRLLHA
jgi:hypothetical protein